MNPIFTLQYSEFELANQLQDSFPQSEGFSIFVPTSRQEKGIDLILVQKLPRGKSKVITFQIKSSRTWSPKPDTKPKATKLQYNSWFNNFDVQDEGADYYLLFVVYFRDENKMGAKRELHNLTLLFTNREMADFLKLVLTKAGTPDKFFGFGFNDDEKIVHNRGNNGQPKDCTRFLLRRRIGKLRRRFGMKHGGHTTLSQVSRLKPRGGSIP